MREIANLRERLDEAEKDSKCYLKCFCMDMEYKFVREATKEDEEQNQLFVEKIQS